MSKFKVGDKVKLIAYNTCAKKKYLGKILEVESRCDVPDTGEEGYTLVGVDYFRFFPNELEKVNEIIVIYSNQNKVIALDKRTGNKAETICSPEDTFDFEFGAKLAFDRLMGRKEKVREVKRKANPGEYIKIVKPQLTFGKYFKGDILKVINAPVLLDYVVVVENRNISATVGNSEYVVLENYEPPKEERSCKCDRDCKEKENTHKQNEEVISNIADSIAIELLANLLKGDK